MADSDAGRWDERYRRIDVATVPVAPDAVVASGLDDLVATSGRALDVACGLGAQTLWLAQRGVDVEAVDVSAEAVRRVGQAARQFGVDDRVNVSRLDLDAGIPASFAHFEVIVCQRFRAPQLYDTFADRLAVGGVLIITVLSQTGAGHPGSYHAAPGELLQAFGTGGFDVRFHAEADGEESLIAVHTA